MARARVDTTLLGLLVVGTGGVVLLSGIRDAPVTDVTRALIAGDPLPRGGDTLQAARSRVAARATPVPTSSGGGRGIGTGVDLGPKIVQAARQYLGVPYRWGGTSRRGLDCSGLVVLALRDVGIQVPRLTSALFLTWGGAVTVPGPPQPGDLVIWPGHIGIATDSDTMIDAPTFGRSVEIGPIWRTPRPTIRRVVARSERQIPRPRSSPESAPGPNRNVRAV